MGNEVQGQPIKLMAKTQTIILHHDYKMNVQISGVDTFPHGLDGLKLWEAGIVLARYMIHNNKMFKNKVILELGSGVGIAGIAAKTWTECKEIYMTDYHPKVVETINRNLQKNNLKCPTFLFDWREADKVQVQYDFIIGSDIVYFGCPVQALYHVFTKLLNPEGVGLIVIPERKNYAKLFLDLIEKDVFEVQIQKLDHETYLKSPLADEVEGYRRYSLLNEIEFSVYKLKRKGTTEKT